MRANKGISTKNGSNGKAIEEFKPRAKDYLKRISKLDKELIEATRDAMAALKEEIAKYGKKDFSGF